jgi:hypothetical protein
MQPFRQRLIERPSARPREQEEQRPQQHRPIGSRLVGEVPKAIALHFAQTEAPEACSQKDGNFCAEDGDQHDADQRERRQPRQQARQQQSARQNFHCPDKGRQDLGRGKANFGEAPSAQLGGIEKFLDALGDKNCAPPSAESSHSRAHRWFLRFSKEYFS